MKCINCGTENFDSAKFCVKCGQSLQTNTVNNTQEVVNTYQQPVAPASKLKFVSDKVINYFMYIVYLFLRPFKNYKENEKKLEDTKNAFILSSIAAAAMMVINLIKSMISVVFTKSLDIRTWKYVSEVNFEYLKNLNYLDLIIKNFIIYFVVIIAIAGIYYIVNLIFKKNSKFTKLLSITATSFFPFIVCGMIISSILGKLWLPLSIIGTFASLAYSIIIFVTLVNDEINFESDGKDKEIYYNLTCIVIIFIITYILMTIILKTALTGDIDVSDLLDII